jgi:DNA-binding IclR family transcriptional regulator
MGGSHHGPAEAAGHTTSAREGTFHGLTGFLWRTMSNATLPAPQSSPRESKLVRGLNLLSCFRPGEALRLSQLAERGGLPVPTAHRLVQELEHWDMLRRVGDRLELGYSLGFLGRRAQGHLQTLFVDALPLLIRLQKVTGLDVLFSGFYGSQVLPIGQLRRRDGTNTISYAPADNPLNSALVAAAMQRYDLGTGAGAAQVITDGEGVGISAGIRPEGTAIRAVIALTGQDRSAVAAAAPHLCAVAHWLGMRMASPAPLVPARPAPEPRLDPPSMLVRGLRLLDCLRAGETQVTLTELAARAGLPKSTAHRLVSVLVDYEFLQMGGSGLLFGPRVLALSSQVAVCPILRAVAARWQRELCAYSGGATCLWIPDPPAIERLTGVYSDKLLSDVSGSDDSQRELVDGLSSAVAQAVAKEFGMTNVLGAFAERWDVGGRPPTVTVSENGHAMVTAAGGLTALAVPVWRGRDVTSVLTLVTWAPGGRAIRDSISALSEVALTISREVAAAPAEPAVGLAPT